MRNNKDYIWAIFLIFLGSILLLNTTGVLQWNVWLYILNYWPIFLILGGLRLILGKSLASSIILSILAIVAFSWIGLCSYAKQSNNLFPFLKNITPFCTNRNITDLESVQKEFTVVSTDYEDVETLEYSINTGVSEFTITDGIDEYLYIDADYTTLYGEPVITTNKTENLLKLEIREERAESFPFVNFESPKYDFVLGTELPTDIMIDNGIGKGRIDFDTQWIKNLKIDTGTGDMNIKLGYDSIPTEELVIDIGTGNITLSLPFDVGYVINYNVGIGTIVLGDRQIGGIGQDADEIRSDNYDDVEKILNITADVGIGQLKINFNN